MKLFFAISLLTTTLGVAPKPASLVEDCTEGCKVAFGAGTLPWYIKVTGGLPPFPGHGICECLLTCLASTPCAESVTLTLDAGEHWLCIGGHPAGHNETIVLSVYGCGDLDSAAIDVFEFDDQCGGHPITSGTLLLACGLCNGDC